LADIPKPKGWRSLRVDNRTFLWRVLDRSRRSASDGLAITIVHTRSETDLRPAGASLPVATALAGHHSCPGCGPQRRHTITPSEVVDLIRRAQQTGWTATSAAPPPLELAHP